MLPQKNTTFLFRRIEQNNFQAAYAGCIKAISELGPTQLQTNKVVSSTARNVAWLFGKMNKCEKTFSDVLATSFSRRFRVPLVECCTTKRALQSCHPHAGCSAPHKVHMLHIDTEISTARDKKCRNFAMLTMLTV